MFFITRLPNISIAVGDTDSPTIAASNVYGDAFDLGFISGATTGDIQVSVDGINFTKLKSLTASTAEVVVIPFPYFRIHLSAAASGSAVVIEFSKRWSSSH